MKTKASIFINQVGYFPKNSKYVYFDEATKGTAVDFEVCDKVSGQTVYTGKVEDSVASKEIDPAAGEKYFCGDFSKLEKTGSYFIRINKKESSSFSISSSVFDDVLFSALNYFKLSRCGNGVCHTGDAEIYGTSLKKNVQGGWHDAGDYGRYTIAASKAVMDLLFAYDNLGADYRRFDILDEVRFELEWMLQMQRDDGAVYHKISCYHFCGFIMPEQEKDQQVLAPVSTAATADFAGVLAYSYKYFNNTDAGFAKSLLKAAEKAQKYLDSHEDELYINPPEITTGGYGDKNVLDERYFAVCGLWAATGKEEYLDKAVEIRKKAVERIPDPNNPWDLGWHEAYGWGMVSGYGSEIILQNESKIPEARKSFVTEIKNRILEQAEEDLNVYRNSAFKICSKHFGWGSNGAICDIAHILVLANKITGKQEYLQAARSQIDYILGCNPVNYCYITGAGANSPVHPHHRPSGASGKVMPGMLVGGPCSGLHDEYARKHLTGKAPLLCYNDVQSSYSTNEVAIYWNSTFVYLLSVCIDKKESFI